VVDQFPDPCGDAQLMAGQLHEAKRDNTERQTTD
jgi:hypothetical protein